MKEGLYYIRASFDDESLNAILIDIETKQMAYKQFLYYIQQGATKITLCLTVKEDSPHDNIIESFSRTELEILDGLHELDLL